MIIVEKEPKSVVSERFKTLRTNLQYSSLDKEYKIIVITSSNPGEGKTTISANLALSLAEGEKKVALIDCDLRKPSVHRVFKISNRTGLSDVLIGQENFSTASKVYKENMTILTAGNIPPNPAEVLASEKMAKLLVWLKTEFDYVILDTPPIQVVTDSQILSTKADGTILVVRAEKTKKDELKNSIGLLKKVNANIIGTVLNGEENSKDDIYYHYGDI
ncbi:CpsD/CapB family tyrosine-protein kinase [Clostridium carnis]